MVNTTSGIDLDTLANTPLQQQTVDPRIAGQMAQVGADTNALPSRYTQGIGTDAGFLTPVTGGQQDAALGGPGNTSAVMSALGARNARVSNDFVDNLKKGVALTAPVIKQQGYQQQEGNINAMGQVNLNNQAILKQQNLNQIRVQTFEQQQQQSIIAGILGIVGAFTGSVIGSATSGGKTAATPSGPPAA